MNRRLLAATVLGPALFAAAAFAPAASAGTVAWSVSVGVPGFAVAAGRPSYYGVPYRPYYRGWYRPVVVAPPAIYAPAPVYPYYGPAPVVVQRPIVYAPRAYVAAPRVGYGPY
jgi:hypothetical protein